MAQRKGPKFVRVREAPYRQLSPCQGEIFSGAIECECDHIRGWHARVCHTRAQVDDVRDPQVLTDRSDHAKQFT